MGKWCLHASLFLGNKDMFKNYKRFDFWHVQTADIGGTKPWKNNCSLIWTLFKFLMTLLAGLFEMRGCWHIGLRWVIVALWATCGMIMFHDISVSDDVCNSSFKLLKIIDMHLSRRMTAPTKWPVCPAKTQIGLGIIPVWSVFPVCMKKYWALNYLLSAQWRLIRLGGCAGWSESSLGAHANVLVLSCGGSFECREASSEVKGKVHLVPYELTKWT